MPKPAKHISDPSHRTAATSGTRVSPVAPATPTMSNAIRGVAPAASTPRADHDPAQRRAIVWCDERHLPLVRAVADAAQLTIIASGCAAGGPASVVAEALSASRTTDLRDAINQFDHDLLWLAAPSDLPMSALAALRERSPLICSSEPIPAGIADCTGSPTDDHAWFIPMARRSPAVRLLADIRPQFGTVRSVSLTMRGRSEHGSLYARLADALDLIEWLCGEVEIVDASMSGPLGSPPDTLRGLHGHLTVNARFPGNCCACAHVSDLGGTWARGVTVLGEGGSVRMTDAVMEWWDADGRLLDSARFFPAENDLPAALIADQLDRLLDPREPAPQPRDVLRNVAVCEAVRLSLHTGQGESPRKLLNLIPG